MIFNETPIRTSKNFKINNIEIKDLEISEKVEQFSGTTIIGNKEHFKLSEDSSKEHLKYGVGKELERQIFENSNQNKKIVIDSGKKEKIYLEFKFDEKSKTLIENLEIVAKLNSNVTIIIKYICDNDDEQLYHNGLIRLMAEKNSNVNIIIVNMLNKRSNNFISIENSINEKANVNYTIIDFGGKNSITNYFSNLVGVDCVNNLNTIYLGTEKQLFDLNYIAEIRGERAQANIEVQGALKDEAIKHFKGTIDFKKGCKKAKGNENEFCILLSEKARAKALPMLLCTEEDVEGNHSTAAGKIEPDRIFYIMSRGFSYKEAMKLIVKAKFNNIINNIEEDDIKELILNEIDKRLD